MALAEDLDKLKGDSNPFRALAETGKLAYEQQRAAKAGKSPQLAIRL